MVVVCREGQRAGPRGMPFSSQVNQSDSPRSVKDTVDAWSATSDSHRPVGPHATVSSFWARERAAFQLPIV